MEERGTFSELQLNPRSDIFQYRLDLIRQQQSQQVSDTTSTTVAVAYHALGFDLGNALFLDLNDNLGIDLFQLLQIDTSRNFIVKKVGFKSNGRKRSNEDVLQKKGNEICQLSPGLFGWKERNCRQISIDNSMLSMSRKNRELYTVNHNSGETTLNRRNRKLARITGESESRYLSGVKKPQKEYKILDNSVTLTGVAGKRKKHFRYSYLTIKHDAASRVIKVHSSSRKKEKLLYEVVRHNNIFYVNNKRGTVSQIAIFPNRLVIYSGNKPSIEVEVVYLPEASS